MALLSAWCSSNVQRLTIASLNGLVLLLLLLNLHGPSNPLKPCCIKVASSDILILFLPHRDWSLVKERVRDHQDFDHFFVEYPSDTSWMEADLFDGSDPSLTTSNRIPYEILEMPVSIGSKFSGPYEFWSKLWLSKWLQLNLQQQTY